MNYQEYGFNHQKMLAGQWHIPDDAELIRHRKQTAILVHEFNQLGPINPERSQEILTTLLKQFPTSATLCPPVFFEYGSHTWIGENAWININLTVLDSAEVTIEDHVLIGPNCQLITVGHPTDSVTRRREGWEQAAPIRICADAWLGAGVIVLPGVTIGARSVIGAGSVVTKDIPADVIAVGNPARVIRTTQSGSRQ